MVDYYGEFLHNEEGDESEQNNLCPTRPDRKTYIRITKYMDTYLDKLIDEVEAVWVSDNYMRDLGNFDQKTWELDIWKLPKADEDRIKASFR